MDLTMKKIELLSKNNNDPKCLEELERRRLKEI